VGLIIYHKTVKSVYRGKGDILPKVGQGYFFSSSFRLFSIKPLVLLLMKSVKTDFEGDIHETSTIQLPVGELYVQTYLKLLSNSLDVYIEREGILFFGDSVAVFYRELKKNIHYLPLHILCLPLSFTPSHPHPPPRSANDLLCNTLNNNRSFTCLNNNSVFWKQKLKLTFESGVSKF